MADLRLGDELDDFCVKCKRVTNHSIVSLLNGAAAKVRCRTCYSDHDFRNEQAPPSKKDLKKAALFNEVLSSVAPASSISDSADGLALAAPPATDAETVAEALPDTAEKPLKKSKKS